MRSDALINKYSSKFYEDLCGDRRTSHHKIRPDRYEIRIGPQAKAYQVGQIREVILKYHLGGKDDAAL